MEKASGASLYVFSEVFDLKPTRGPSTRWARTYRLVVVWQSSSSSSFVLDRGSWRFARWKEDEPIKQALGVSLLPPEKTAEDEGRRRGRRRSGNDAKQIRPYRANPIHWMFPALKRRAESCSPSGAKTIRGH